MSRRAPSPDLLVIGGGIIGLAAAEAAARRGMRCLVVDRGDPGQASWASAGMIAPLAEVPGRSPVDQRFFDICRRSRDLWAEWAERLEDATGIDLGYDRTGALVIERADALEDAARRVGEPHQRLAEDEARRLVPDLRRPLDVLHLAGEHRIDNRAVCGALRRRLEARGVEIRRGVSVESITVTEGAARVRVQDQGQGQGQGRGSGSDLAAGRVLVAAGAWTPELVGDPPDLSTLPAVPIRPLRGQMLRLDGVAWPFTGSIRGDHFYAVRRGADQLLVGATEDEAGFDPRVTAEGTASLLGWARRLFPGLGDRPVAESWAGLRPTPPDGRPLLGPAEESGTVWLAAGHHRNGILLAPWTAETLGRWIADGEAPESAVRELFAPHRFHHATETSFTS